MLTLAQAAARLGLSPSTLRNQLHAGKLRGRLVGKTWTVTEGEIERYRRDSLGRPGRRHEASPKTS
jgi:excisionase family DNA binding protein